MIIIKKPFCYLRDMHEWKYGLTRSKTKELWFMDLNHIMMLEKREKMSCKLFHVSEEDTTVKDAGYITISLLVFLNHSNIYKKDLFCQYCPDGAWNWDFIRLGLKVIQNAEICIPTKDNYPLMIRNEKFIFYVASKEKARKYIDSH